MSKFESRRTEVSVPKIIQFDEGKLKSLFPTLSLKLRKVLIFGFVCMSIFSMVSSEKEKYENFVMYKGKEKTRVRRTVPGMKRFDRRESSLYRLFYYFDPSERTLF